MEGWQTGWLCDAPSLFLIAVDDEVAVLHVHERRHPGSCQDFLAQTSASCSLWWLLAFAANGCGIGINQRPCVNIVSIFSSPASPRLFSSFFCNFHLVLSSIILYKNLSTSSLFFLILAIWFVHRLRRHQSDF